MSTVEVNFDGLVGPTHNYAGLSPGNFASSKSAGRRSHPRKAALQGLDKMAKLHALGIPQAVLPPQPRPALDWLRTQGFGGSDERVIERVAAQDRSLLAAAYSASSMWTANAATVIPSCDAADDRLHFVPANLASQRHRSIESADTARVLRTIFASEDHFVHHEPVSEGGDEGAANHTRFCRTYGEPGIELFVYGARPTDGPGPIRHVARQSEAASRTVARIGRVERDRVLFVQQNPDAIDAGVFHNDVIATGDRNLFLLHEDAFVDQARALAEIREVYARKCGGDLRVCEIARERLPISRAVESYLFNCQIVSRPKGEVAWIGPLECAEDAGTHGLLEQLASPAGPFDELHFIDLRESMWNGGGPACLRLRVVLTEAERAASHPGVYFDEVLHTRLRGVIEKHYREAIDPEDLADPKLVEESRAALDALTQVLGLGSVYRFQNS